jgi:excisionase family DNA binding protein
MARRSAEKIDTNTAGETKPWSLVARIESYQGLMTIDDVAEVLGVSDTTVYRMAQRKQIPSLIIGGRRKFDPAALGMHYRRKSPESASAARAVTAAA